MNYKIYNLKPFMIGVKKNINILLKDVKGICKIKIDLAEIKMSRFNL